MKKRTNSIHKILLLLFCIGISTLGASGRTVRASQEEPEAARRLLQTAGNGAPDIEGKSALEGQMRGNEEWFFEEAERQGVERELAEKLFGRLLADGIFQNGIMELTGLRIDDIDGNGRMDMLVMVQDAEAAAAYGAGGLWFYINEDRPCCFSEEECSYSGAFDTFWEDVDNDGNIEIIFRAEGSGCGAAGDSCKKVFKYKDHAIEQMELPSDFEVNYDCGLTVDVIQDPDTDSYWAYCPYLDEIISFSGENECGLSETAQVIGGNVRGYSDLSVTEYEGKHVLQASEYLCGEDGAGDCAATAQFLITWEEDGTPVVLSWRVEEEI